MSKLFETITLRPLTARNRVWLAPMCQYSATDGVPDDWHLVHLMHLVPAPRRVGPWPRLASPRLRTHRTTLATARLGDWA